MGGRNGFWCHQVCRYRIDVCGANIQNVPELRANFQDYKIWYPIPSREIELNPNLTQNDGYTN
ncbi:RagB/SusD family nutrient uptake outer membrane protein [Parapedobacter tibetensis]|uniref:RagB/SusD family nutrient uptake outer membrane protein n=1 Tax=Parapedobacter tibetensis TaxID=2972951 RepID=UPI00356B6FC4